MLLGALGDVHRDWTSVRAIMARHPRIPDWICVGDLGDDEGVYEEVGARLHWIKGNNERFDRLAAGDLPANLIYLPNALVRRVRGAAIAGLGGTYAPTWYDTDPEALPHPLKGTMKATALADKRRHFVRGEVEALKTLQGVDVLLTHEAPRPFRVGRLEAGKQPINEVIASLKPRLHLFGHHHRYAEQLVGETRSICLDLVSRSYVLIDTETWAHEKLVIAP